MVLAYFGINFAFQVGAKQNAVHFWFAIALGGMIVLAVVAILGGLYIKARKLPPHTKLEQ